MSRRFGLLMDPLDMTGLCGSLCEPYWLVTVSGFQGSSCSGFPAYPAVLPAACRLSRVRRQGDTIRTRREAVNGLPEVFSTTLSAAFRTWIRGNKNASRGATGRRQSVTGPHRCGFRFRYGFDFRSHLLVFNTRSSVSADSQRRGVVLYQRPCGGARVLRRFVVLTHGLVDWDLHWPAGYA
jgi:hypothetical protein